MNPLMDVQPSFRLKRFIAIATLKAACILWRKERLDPRTNKDEESLIHLVWLKTNLVNHKHVVVSIMLARKLLLANGTLE